MKDLLGNDYPYRYCEITHSMVWCDNECKDCTDDDKVINVAIYKSRELRRRHNERKILHTKKDT